MLNTAETPDKGAATLPASNPLAAPSPLKFGLPDFAAIKLSDLEPAVLAGIAEQEAQWEAIATNPEAPTVENTYTALELSGQLLHRAVTVLYTLSSSIGGDELDALEEKLTVPLAEHQSKLMHDRRIYDRLAAIDLLSAGPDATYGITELLKDYRRGGIELDATKQARLRELESEMSRLSTKFAQTATKAMENGPLLSAAELAGINPETNGRCSAETNAAGETVYRVRLDNTSQQDVAPSITSAVGRAKLLEASLERAHGDQDTRPLVRLLADLRAEYAQLLGFKDFASLVADANVVGDAGRVWELLRRVGTAAAGAAADELATLQDFAGADNPIAASDWTYWAAKYRAERAGIPESELEKYFELENVFENGVFYAANQLYGLNFTPQPQLHGWHEDVRVWLVTDAEDHERALFLLDPYARTGKAGGAWMHELVTQSRLLNQRPVIANNLNLVKPKSGPTLVPFSEVITCFHEFGHALHGMLSDCYYPSQAGTASPSDWVELPSQLNEMWAYNPQVLRHMGRHVETGEPLSEELIARIIELRTLGRGFGCAEFTAAATVDQAIHRLPHADTDFAALDVDAFEAQALADTGFAASPFPPRYRLTYFTHSFGGGYEAGYYSYQWAELYAAQLEEWFQFEAAAPASTGAGNDGGLNRVAGESLMRELLSRGTTRDPEESFRAIIGHDPQVEPLLRRNGLLPQRSH